MGRPRGPRPGDRDGRGLGDPRPGAGQPALGWAHFIIGWTSSLLGGVLVAGEDVGEHAAQRGLVEGLLDAGLHRGGTWPLLVIAFFIMPGTSVQPNSTSVAFLASPADIFTVVTSLFALLSSVSMLVLLELVGADLVDQAVADAVGLLLLQRQQREALSLEDFCDFMIEADSALDASASSLLPRRR